MLPCAQFRHGGWAWFAQPGGLHGGAQPWCASVQLYTWRALNARPSAVRPPPAFLQSAFGRSSLAVSSLLSYVGLGLGLLGSSLALPFGLYVLICQRTAGARACCRVPLLLLLHPAAAAAAAPPCPAAFACLPSCVAAHPCHCTNPSRNVQGKRCIPSLASPPPTPPPPHPTPPHPPTPLLPQRHTSRTR